MDEQAKKTALRTIPYGLYLVGSREPEVEDDAEHLNAFVASWVTQCSFKPPLVTLGVRTDSRSNGMIRRGGVFSLNLLGAGQKDVAIAFFKDLTIRDGHMNGVPYEVGAATGTPLFPDLPASLECRLVAAHDHDGDHTLFVGEVVEAHVRTDKPAPLTHEDTGWNYGG